MQVTPMKLLGVAVTLFYGIGAVVVQGSVTSSVVGVWVMDIFALTLIWFPDEFGRFKGYTSRGGGIDAETPGPFIAAMGWFFLIGLSPLIYLLSRLI